ncbi:tRNA1(Val) (adenine(37)-N6)-methyltransferase [Salmonella enterica subsp. enterica serovar Choleraesuis]|nr:tRNA1(Val) (adenine(37)-N6)-methyltransferase [Salmonella enterica subsp. enterica serovar Choleraesuis]
MKVGTDGILLGAWAPIAGVQRILDIGSGSGLIGLMLAQRTEGHAQIDCVELDSEAADQARENVQASPWPESIRVHCADIKEWAGEQEGRYQLIVSNPPFFEPGIACATSQRDMARTTASLDHSALLNCAARLINEDGFFCVVLPTAQGESFSQLAKEQGWFCRYRMDVSETEVRAPHRMLLALSPSDGEHYHERIAIRDPDQHYSEAWRGLTGAFYLAMAN